MTDSEKEPFFDQSKLIPVFLNALDEQFFSLDTQGNYLFFNKSHAEMMQNCYGNELHLNLNPLFLISESTDKKIFNDALNKALAGLKETVVHEFGNSKKKKIWFEFIFSPVFNAKGIQIGVSVVGMDVSKKISLESELRYDKEAALADARAKSAFLSSMSHEIRTPMNAIIGLTELLINKKLDENSSENLKAIRFSANNLLTIINDILDFSKIEAGKFTFEIQAFDFFSVLEELNKSITLSALAKNILYEIQISGSIPKYLKGDAVRLSQILLNLLGNSIKFTQTGKIKLNIDILSENETEIVLEFKVSDTGIGIPKDKLNSIFNSFTQVHSNQRFKSQGTGLGLSITKRLVEMQAGEISVKSTVGKGTTFTFFLSYLKATQKDFEKEEGFEEIDFGKFVDLKVLLVEDNKINQLLARQILTSWGVTVELANDGFEAIAKLQRRTFDIILLDLQMPEIDGFEVARFVRKTLKSPANQIPIVALTADAFTETKIRAKEAGMNDFITKPYQQKDLFRVLRKFSSSEDEKISFKPLPGEKNELSKSLDFEFIKEKFGKDQDTFKYILGVFKNDICEEISSASKFLEEMNGQAAIKLVHKLVSTFSAMGMQETATTLSLMERMLKQNENLEIVIEKMRIVESQYNDALKEINPVLESFNDI
jgi:signal transduction histidine kinase/ActR/RegA family two-component response regulator